MYVKHCQLTRYQQLELIKYFVAGTPARRQLNWQKFIAIQPSGFSTNYAPRLPANKRNGRLNFVVKSKLMRVISGVGAKESVGAERQEKSSYSAC